MSVFNSQNKMCCRWRGRIAGETHGVVGFNERIVDSDDVDVVVLNSIAEDDTTNTAESVDANLGGSHDSGVVRWCVV